MALIIEGDFSTEKEKSDSRFAAVDAAIATIESQIEVLKGAWQDEKSETFITAINDYVTEIKPKLTTAKTDAESTFDQLKNCLKIYTEQ